jgi:hypothetical protein
MVLKQKFQQRFYASVRTLAISACLESKVKIKLVEDRKGRWMLKENDLIRSIMPKQAYTLMMLISF